METYRQTAWVCILVATFIAVMAGEAPMHKARCDHADRIIGWYDAHITPCEVKPPEPLRCLAISSDFPEISGCFLLLIVKLRRGLVTQNEFSRFLMSVGCT